MVGEFAQHLLNGIITGGTYALLGIGLTLIFGIMNVVNFAHGEFYTLGAFMAFYFSVGAGVPFYSALALAILSGVLIGFLCERVLLKSIRTESIETSMLAMIGLWIFMQNTELLIWGGIPKTIPYPFPAKSYSVAAIFVHPIRLFVFGTAVAIILLTHLAIQRTKVGKAMRATFQDREVAALMGVNIDRIHAFTFALGSGLAAAAGALLGPVFIVYPTMGDLAALKSFAIVIMGGLGNFYGAIMGGLLLGVAESLGAAYISSGYKDGIGFIMIILILLFKPAGLFGRVERAS